MMIGLLGLFVKLSLFSLIAFGGVNALLPTLYDISVNQEKWIDADTFIHYFAIAQCLKVIDYDPAQQSKE